MADHPTYVRFRALCLSLPDTVVTMTWGSPHLRIVDKIFTGWSRWPDDGGWSFSVKLQKDQQAALVASDPRFSVAAYVGKHGWVAVSIADGQEDWNEIAALVEEGYRNVGGPKRAAALEKLIAKAPAVTSLAKRTAAAAKSNAEKPAATKSAAKQSPARRSSASRSKKA